jgi:predicted O-methyltransferase YrrM
VRVFISYARDDRDLADAMTRLLAGVSSGITIDIDQNHGGLTGAGPGESWFAWILERIRSADEVIALLTPASVMSDWVLWETGIAAAVKERAFTPVLLGIEAEDLPAPLRHLTAILGTHRDPMQNMLTDLVTNMPQTAHKHAFLRLGDPRILNEYLATVCDVLERRRRHPAERARRAARQLRRQLTPASVAGTEREPLLSRVLGRYLEGITSKLVNPQESLTVPANEYPMYLLDLLEGPDVDLRAVALVDDVEHFWSRDLGEKIRRKSKDTKSARRVFVFRSEDSLRDYMHVLLKHAADYDIRLLPLSELAARFPEHAHDFSIVDRPGEGGVLARYRDDARAMRAIEFTAAPIALEDYRDTFEQIWQWSRALPGKVKNDARSDATDHDKLELMREVFRGVATGPHHEMSRYIDVREYDRCEEKHPHYVEMMERMLAVYRAHCQGLSLKVLEMGAGTGLFTRRLVGAEPAADRIIALELDERCYRLLRHHVARHAHVTVYNEDSVKFDPPGKFDFVFSSFSDHHIATDQATAVQYLDNVKRNMHHRSSFIVGDEFLGNHDHRNPDERRRAIIAYHDYILEVARMQKALAPASEQQAFDTLLRLEEDAKQSGLAVVDGKPGSAGGDYKVSLDHYLARLRAAGFAYDDPTLIGPSDTAQAVLTGGIWVVRAYLPAEGRGGRA